MLIVFGWFTEKGELYDARSGLHRRLHRFVDARVPRSWRREMVEGPGWGMFAAAVDPGDWNWDLLTRRGDILVATVGLPVGLDGTSLSGGPIGLGTAILKGHQVLDDVVPPFGVLATDGARAVVQQDWFGMASLYVYRSRGVVAFSNRPLLLPYALGDPVRPNLAAWARYTACDTFAGPVAPVTGVEALGPGQAMILESGRDNRWHAVMRQGLTLDDIAGRGVELSPEADWEALALSGLTRVTTSLLHLWQGPLRCGLSGGRDSRLLAANLIANGLPVDFYTHTDEAVEGEIAERLIQIARRARTVELTHTLRPPRKGGGEGREGLGQRLEGLLLDYDFSTRRQSLLRRGGRRPTKLPAVVINGGIGDVAHGIWVPKNWQRPVGNPPHEVVTALRRGLASKAGGPLVEPATRYVDDYLAELHDRSAELGLDQLQSLTWMYLASRGRTWPTARHSFEQAMPFATTEFVTAVIALPLAEVQSSRFHGRIIERLMPEWAGIEFAHGGGATRVDKPRIWDGDGLSVLTELAECTTAQLTWMLDRSEVDQALATVSRADIDNRQIIKADRLLATFAALANAERELESLNSELSLLSKN